MNTTSLFKGLHALPISNFGIGILFFILFNFSSYKALSQASQSFENIETVLNCGLIFCFYSDPDDPSTQHELVDANGIPVRLAGSGTNMGFLTEFVPSRTGLSGEDGLTDGDAFGVAGPGAISAELMTTAPAGAQVFLMDDPDGQVNLYFDYVNLEGTSNPQMSLQYFLSLSSWENSDGANDRLYVRVEIDNCAQATTITLIDTDGGGAGGGGNGDINDLNIESAWNTLSASLQPYIGCRAQLIIEFDSNSSNEELGIDNIIFTEGVREDFLLDPCPDLDNDGVCDQDDICFGDNSTGDSDGDGICNDLDICDGGNDNEDADEDGIPDFCDLCFGDNSTGDTDGDGICDDLDVNIFGTSFEEPEGLDFIYVDSGDPQVPHFLENNPGDPPVNYTFMGGELGFTSFFIPTRDFNGISTGLGLTDGNEVGVTPENSVVGAYTDGDQGFKFEDTDGIMRVALDALDLNNSINPTVSIDYFLRSSDYEFSDGVEDNFRIYLDIDEGSSTIDLINTAGNDLDDLGIEGSWNTLTANLPVGSLVRLIIDVDFNSTAEELFIDNIIFTGGGSVVAGPPCIPPFISSLTSNVDEICPGEVVDLSIEGVLNDATEWRWYTESCGGTLAGTGTSIQVSPTSTTTYFVRGEGGCNGTTGLCQSRTITVNPATYNVTSSTTSPSCPEVSSGSFPDGSFSISISDMGCCFGAKYDIAVSPVPGSTTLGNTPAPPALSEYLDVSSGDYVFPLVSSGAYRVAISVREGCQPLTDPQFFVVIVPDPADTQEPNAGCQNIAVNLNTNGLAAIIPSDVELGSTDNCDVTPIPISVSPSFFTCDDIGPNLVTLTVSDLSGNTSTCSALVNVLGELGPTVVCQDIIIALDDEIQTGELVGDGMVSIDVEDVDGGSFNTCGDLMLSIDVDNFTCADIDMPNSFNYLGQTLSTGEVTVLLTGEDNAGLTSTCAAVVTVIDTIRPTAICQDFEVALDANGNLNISASDIDAGSEDICGIGSFNFLTANNQLVPSLDLDCDAIGETPLTLQVTDVNGNTNRCTSVISIIDNSDPVAVCQDLMIELDQFGQAEIIPEDLGSGSTDNCDVLSFAASPTMFSSADIGTNTVLVTVTDASGNSASCASTVEVAEEISLILNCPPEQMAFYDENCSLVLPDYTTLATVFDKNDPNPTITQIPAPGTVVSENTTVSIIATSSDGDSLACNFEVMIQDTIPPVAVCNPISVTLGETGFYQLNSDDINQILEGTSDNCYTPNFDISQNTFSTADVGENEITFQFSDGNFNWDTCNVIITVIDPTPLSINCSPQQQEVLDAECIAVLPDYRTEVEINDPNNANPVLVQEPDAGTIIEENTTVVITATNDLGEIATCTFMVMVEDNTSPVATCNPLSITLEADGNYTLSASDIEIIALGSEDNCGPLNFSIAPDSFDDTMLGPNTVLLAVSDGDGNVGTCEATVTVNALMTFEIDCPENQTESLDASCAFVLEDYTTLAMVTDPDDPNPILSQEPVAGTIITENTSVTLTATNTLGNSVSCSFLVNLEDTSVPNVVCNDISVELGMDGTYTLSQEDIEIIANGSTDNCSTLDLSISPDNFDANSIGQNEIVLLATDASGNSATCTGIITVEEATIEFEVICPENQEASFDADCMFTLEDYTGLATISNPEITGISITQLPTPGTVVDGNTEILLIASNGADLLDSCTFELVLEDNTAPVAVCNPITVMLESSGTYTITQEDIAAIGDGTTDNCGTVTLTLDPTTFTTNDIGANTVLLTATDLVGNGASCMAVVTVTQSTGMLELTCPEDQTEALNTDCVFIMPDYRNSVIISPADLNNLIITQFPTPGNVIEESTLVSITATSDFGESATCSFQLTVEDITPPEASCNPITIEVADTYVLTNEDIALISAGSSDNCGVVFSTVVPNTFDTLMVGSNLIVLSIFDENQNTVSCTTTVTVVLVNEELEISCPGDQPESFDEDCAFILPDYTTFAVAMDPNDPNPVITQAPEPGTVISASTTITLTATNSANEIATCSFDVNLEDNTAPQIHCTPITVTLDNTGNYTLSNSDLEALAAGSDDNCGIVNLAANPNQFGSFDLGENSVELIATDAAGNTNACTTTVTVQASDNPISIECPGDTMVNFATNCSYMLPDFRYLATTSGPAYTPTQDPPVGTIIFENTTVTLSTQDAEGNTASCTFEVLPQDITSPTVTCPSIVKPSLNEDCEYILEDLTYLATALDKCDQDVSLEQSLPVGTVITGLTTIAITATDDSGNFASCTFKILPKDAIPPTLTNDCPEDIVLTGPQPVYWTPPLATDNCGIYNIASTHKPGAFFGIGNTIVTYTFQDIGLNTTSCSFSVTINPGVNGDDPGSLDLDVATDDVIVEELFLSPNPAVDELNLRFYSSVEKDLELRILDSQGRSVKELIINTNIGINTKALDIQALPVGMYWLELEGAGAARIQRFVKGQ